MKVDDGMTVEVHAVEPASEGAGVFAKKNTAADVLRRLLAKNAAALSAVGRIFVRGSTEALRV